MGPLNAEDAEQTVTPIADLESDFGSNSTSPQSSLAASPYMIGLLTLPTVLQEAEHMDKWEHRRSLSINSNLIEALSIVDAAGSMGLLDPYTQSKFLLPGFPESIYNMGFNGLRWLSENPLRQRGLRFRPEENPKSFVTCQLCGNSILGNREINLQNHARRHSTLKQFQCCYCNYVHSEITKVRLHMAHNHNDNYSRPINNVNSEMRESWRALMNDCFPGHSFVNEQFQRRCAQQATMAAIQHQRMRSSYSQPRYCPF